MLVFDNTTISITSISTPALFYHSNVSVSGDYSNGRYISCKTSFTDDAFITHTDYFFSHCELDVDPLLVDVLAPLNILSVEEYEAKAETIYFSETPYRVDRYDSGNCLNFDKRYAFLDDLYVPLVSFNGITWKKGLDLNEDTSFDYFFFYEAPTLRDSVTFSTGDHVGVFVPSTIINSILFPSGILQFISGLLPAESFIPEEIIKITGILDNYNTAGLVSIFPRDGLELRSFLRSVAVTLGRITGGVLSLREVIRVLKTPSASPDTFMMDLNKHFTFRVGESLFNYNPASGLLSFNADLINFPFYFTDNEHLLNVVRIVSLPTATLNINSTYLVYLNLDTATVVTVDVSSFNLYEAMTKVLALAAGNNIIPLMGIRVDEVRQFKKTLFFQTALVGSLTTDNEKFNALVRSFATKSRSANLFSNIDRDSDYLLLIRDVVDKSLAKDTRVFMFLQDSITTAFVDTLGSLFTDPLGVVFTDPENVRDSIYIEELT